MKNLFVCILILLFIISCSKTPNVPTEPFDPSYSELNNVLHLYSKNGMVDYDALRADRENIDSYINQLAGTDRGDLDDMTENEQLAYWINAFNGLTIRSIIDTTGINSVHDISGGWKLKKWYIAERELSLEEIEHEILRKQFHDPRVHFALNYGMQGSIGLLESCFSGVDLDSQLDTAARKFVHNSQKHFIDFENHVIKTNEVFRWYWRDFESRYNQIKFNNAADIENAVLNFSYQFLDNSLKQNFDTTVVWSVRFYRYDYGLNNISDMKQLQ